MFPNGVDTKAFSGYFVCVIIWNQEIKARLAILVVFMALRLVMNRNGHQTTRLLMRIYVYILDRLNRDLH